MFLLPSIFSPTATHSLSSFSTCVQSSPSNGKRLPLVVKQPDKAHAPTVQACTSQGQSKCASSCALSVLLYCKDGAKASAHPPITSIQIQATASTPKSVKRMQKQQADISAEVNY